MSILATIDALHAELDAHPDAHDTRRILADALEDSGDPELVGMAAGYRAMGAGRLRPNSKLIRLFGVPEPYTWGWRRDGSYRDGDPPDCYLPDDWSSSMGMHLYRARREAEDAAAKAFALLPTARQRELLAPAEAHA